MKDRDIVGLYWERNETAITESQRKYGNYCHSISYSILYSNEDAEECVNDTWVGAWKAMPPHRPTVLSTFLGKITRNISLNRAKHYSAQKRGQGQAELALGELESCVPDKISTEQIFDEILAVQAINDFLYAQPKQKRNIFIKRYWFLHSIKDIAEFYAVSESKVASILFHMRNELKLRLQKEGITL